MKSLILSVLLITSVSQARLQGACSLEAKTNLRTIVGLTQTKADMKKFEVREVKLADISEDVTGTRNETYMVTFGYKDSELSYENYKTQMTLSFYGSQQKCVLKKYLADY